jgi:phosphoribosylformylglycinamidine synthase II
MIHTVRVVSTGDSDPLGEDLAAEARRSLATARLRRVRSARVYRLEGVSAAEAARLARELLAEAVEHRYVIDGPVFDGAVTTVEVAYLPGVMNPEAESILRAARDLGIAARAVDSSVEYAFEGDLDGQELDRIVARLLVNPTIQRVVDQPPETLLIEGTPGAVRTIPIARLSDEALANLSAAGLYLDLDEMRTIATHFRMLGREATDVELEVLAQTWSEHCKHKTFRRPLIVDGVRKPPLLERLMAQAREHSDLVVSAFADNSGVMQFYDGWALAGKVETHNSPSAIEPYGGAMTGSGGVFRDILGTGQGAAVIASTDMFCFAPPDLPDEDVHPGALRPDYLLRRVVAGVRDYGNRMGIPTNNGSVHFHRDFRAKPTVIVGAYGLLPEARARKGRPRPGDRILTLGGRTGRDGIHGATFSSTAMTSVTMAVNAAAVQIGNAVEEKRLLDAVLACRDEGLVRAITDCGAGGYSSAVGEMAEGVGAEVHLERVPLKYTGLAPWEIFVSESQERMVMAVAPQDVEKVVAVCRTFNVEATDIGAFVPTGSLTVMHGGAVVADLDLQFLHDGLPERELAATWRPGRQDQRLPAEPGDEGQWLAALEGVLSQPTVASKETIVRQYDHTVQGTAVVVPYGGRDGNAPNDAAVLAPLHGRREGVVIAHGLHPVLATLDPYWAALWAGAEALANYTAVGGDYREACLIDNFIWPVPTPTALGGLDRAVDGCVDLMRAIGRPFISGKDSLSSTYRYPDGTTLEIPPVLCVSVFGRIPDVRASITADFKAAGSTLVFVGAPDVAATGGSIYLECAGLPGNLPPRVDLELLPAILGTLSQAIESGQVLACHDVSHGGLAVAVAEMAFGGSTGAEVDLAGFLGRRDLALFGETAATFVVELAAGGDPAVLFAGAPHVVLGRTTADGCLTVRDGPQTLFRVALAALEAVWRAPLEALFH